MDDHVNLGPVYDGYTYTYQYDTGRLPTVVDPISHRANMTYDAAADQVDQPIIIEKKPEKPDDK